MNTKLIAFRQNCNLTQFEMSKKLHISKSYYEKLERGDRQPSYRVIKTFNAVFNDKTVDVREIFLT